MPPAALDNRCRSVDRHRHSAAETGRGGVGGHGDRGVAGTRQLHTVGTELSGAVDRQGEPARLERAGRIAGLFLHPDLDARRNAPYEPQQRRASFTQVDATLEIEQRQELSIAPQTPGAPGEPRLEFHPASRIETIAHEPGRARRRQESRSVELGRFSRLAADQLIGPALDVRHRRIGRSDAFHKRSIYQPLHSGSVR